MAWNPANLRRFELPLIGGSIPGICDVFDRFNGNSVNTKIRFLTFDDF
jgi:hypothetical protein